MALSIRNREVEKLARELSIGSQCARLPVLDARSDEQILGYDGRAAHLILDTSALLAILQREPESVAFAQAIEAASVCRVSAATLVEASIVMAGRRGPAGVALLDRLLQVADIEIVPVDAKQALAARSAWERYGLGNHSAGLNSGDCFAYALAGVNAEPLLFKGDDFSRTDIVSACT